MLSAKNLLFSERHCVPQRCGFTYYQIHSSKACSFATPCPVCVCCIIDSPLNIMRGTDWQISVSSILSLPTMLGCAQIKTFHRQGLPTIESNPAPLGLLTSTSTPSRHANNAEDKPNHGQGTRLQAKYQGKRYAAILQILTPLGRAADLYPLTWTKRDEKLA